MFKQAVQVHNAMSPTSPPSAAYKQASIGNAFNRAGTAATRPLANGANQNTAGMQRPSGVIAQGTKRTSNGLAKSLSSQEDVLNYPSLNIVDMEKENELPAAFHTSSRSNSGSLASALFDEDDFDSDIDLDVEDPATKGTVTYPTLPQVALAGSRDSVYSSRPQSAMPKPEVNSSQPIPWSSSPVEHFQTPKKPEPPKTKRRQLPWAHITKVAPSLVDEIEEEEEDASRSKKRKPMEAVKAVSTPAPKTSKIGYEFNTTASAIKQQQKALRENMKAKSKTSQGTEDDVKEAIKKKKKNTVHRIFLSEEQTNVLNLVSEYKKSVFFTGSAGAIICIFLNEINLLIHDRYR
jgi:ATP-dependent DNA helicase PIF1